MAGRQPRLENHSIAPCLYNPPKDLIFFRLFPFPKNAISGSGIVHSVRTVEKRPPFFDLPLFDILAGLCGINGDGDGDRYAGEGDGEGEGDREGDLEGDLDGDREGDGDGDRDIDGDGDRDGDIDGDIDGDRMRLGDSDGDLIDGDITGDTDNDLDGDGDRDEDRDGEGDRDADLTPTDFDIDRDGLTARERAMTATVGLDMMDDVGRDDDGGGDATVGRGATIGDLTPRGVENDARWIFPLCAAIASAYCVLTDVATSLPHSSSHVSRFNSTSPTFLLPISFIRARFSRSAV